jgi:hypothetical protein
VKELKEEKVEGFNREEQQVVVELIEEYTRRGNFELVFPRASTISSYTKYFKSARASNTIIWRWLKMSATQRTNFLKNFKMRKNMTSMGGLLTEI